MRIQHNIPAMSAYRNYTNNVSAMKKNLEKLSSGYKINRAGDDAAGLAISEKMRAQISGLEQAQKNAKDGISLVQTAEGALTEVHDMLNRMYTLAEQSANGTYDNDVDRAQLQKEVDSLRTEIDRIADSSNFNGLKLLDGSMSQAGTVTTTTPAGTQNIDSSIGFVIGGTSNVAAGTKGLLGNIALASVGNTLGVDTIVHQDGAAGNTGTEFSIDLHKMKFDNVKGNKLTIQIGSGANGAKIELIGKGTGALEGGALASAVKTAAGTSITIKGQKFNVLTTATPTGESRISFQQAAVPNSAGEEVNGSMKVTISGALMDNPTHTAGTAQNNVAVKVTTPNISSSELKWNNNTDQIGSKGAAQLTGRIFTVDLPDRSITVTLGAAAATTDKNNQVVAVASTDTMKAIADKITAALKAGATAGRTITDNANITTIGPGLKAGDEIYAVSTATFAMSASGVISATTLKAKKYTVTANGTVGAGAAAATIAAVAFRDSAQGGVTVSKSIDWTSTTNVDTSFLAGKDFKFQIGDKTYTVNLKSASTTTLGNNDVKLTKGGDKPADLLERIKQNLQMQIDADNDAGAANTAADYIKVTNLTVTGTAGGNVIAQVTLTPQTAPKLGDVVTGDHYNTETTDIKNVTFSGGQKYASTNFKLDRNMIANGAKLSFGGATYAITTDKSKMNDANTVYIGDIADNKGIVKADKLAVAAQRITDAAAGNALWTVGANSSDGTKLTFMEKTTNTTVDLSTASKIAANFKWTRTVSQAVAAATDVDNYGKTGAKSLTLQIGDDGQSFNQLRVDISDCHVNAMGVTRDVTLDDGRTIKVVEDGKSIEDISIASQESAQKALEVIKAAINYVSDVRGGLGATQNRLDHTINNLSVMQENIQDAESSIRDVDVAEEMMAYTKNNILIQSAQAMLAQANQMPQGVLQLLQ